MVNSYIYSDLLKELDYGETKLGSDYNSEGQMMTQKLNIKPTLLETVYKRLKKMGWRYNNRSKTFYVDEKDNPAQK